MENKNHNPDNIIADVMGTANNLGKTLNNVMGFYEANKHKMSDEERKKCDDKIAGTNWQSLNEQLNGLNTKLADLTNLGQPKK